MLVSPVESHRWSCQELIFSCENLSIPLEVTNAVTFRGPTPAPPASLGSPCGSPQGPWDAISHMPHSWIRTRSWCIETSSHLSSGLRGYTSGLPSLHCIPVQKGQVNASVWMSRIYAKICKQTGWSPSTQLQLNKGAQNFLPLSFLPSLGPFVFKENGKFNTLKKI